MSTTAHTSVRTVRSYVADGQLFSDPSSSDPACSAVESAGAPSDLFAGEPRRPSSP